MKEKGPHGLKKEFDTLEKFDRGSTYDVFKYERDLFHDYITADSGSQGLTNSFSPNFPIWKLDLKIYYP